MSAQATGWGQSPPAPQLFVCVLCGQQGPEVRHGLLRFRDGEPYGWGPRCRDTDACHARVLALGDEWLLDDGRPRGSSNPRADHPGIMPAAETDHAGELDFGQAPEAVA